MSLIYELPGELAYHGHRVKVYDTNAEALRKAKEELETQKEELRRDELMLVADFVVRKQNKPEQILPTCTYLKKIYSKQEPQ